MYSFSDEPGSVSALKRFVNSTSTNGAISAAVMLLSETQLFKDERYSQTSSILQYCNTKKYKISYRYFSFPMDKTYVAMNSLLLENLQGSIICPPHGKQSFKSMGCISMDHNTFCLKMID